MAWLNLFILILIAAGHTELMVTIINRVHSLPISRPKLHRFRRVEDAVMVAFPFLLLWFVGLRGPAVLYGGRWSDVSPFWMIYLGLCGLGLLGFAWSTIRWRVRRTPAVQISNHSRTVDIAKQLGYKPLGKGGYGFLASLPGNEALKVQVSDKRYALSRVPAEWHELSILHLADTHFVGNLDRPFFEEIARLGAEMRPDLIVFTGDLLDDMQLLPWFRETFGRLQAPLGCFYVLGNHDWFYGAEEIREEFARCGWQDVAGRSISVEHRGHRLEIAGTERPWMGAHPKFTGAADDFRLLLSHTPDHFAWARAQGVDVMLAGHNHGGQVVLPVIGPVFAPSRYGVRYAAGAFWADPTLLYVSRGLSGRHPLRLNCPPELTRLVLESPGRRTTDGA
jgi:predicted MPP superfamily phosphohydrolase